jgi:MFS family permease
MSRTRGFVGLMTAEAISLFGGRMTFLALPWLVLVTTGSATRTGVIAFAEMVPYVLVSAAGGPLVDRMGHRRTAIVMDLASALVVGAIPLLYRTGGLAFEVLVILVMAAGAARGLGDSGKRVLFPVVVARAGVDMTRATTIRDGLSRAATLIGAPVAGVLIAATDAPTVLLLDAASFVVSALIVASLVRPTPAPPSADPLPTVPVATTDSSVAPDSAAPLSAAHHPAAPIPHPSASSAPHPSASSAPHPSASSAPHPSASPAAHPSTEPLLAAVSSAEPSSAPRPPVEPATTAPSSVAHSAAPPTNTRSYVALADVELSSPAHSAVGLSSAEAAAAPEPPSSADHSATPSHGEPSPVERQPGLSYLGQLREGVAFVRGNRLVLGLVGMLFATNLFDQAYSAVFVPVWAKQAFGSPVGAGLTFAAFAGGAVAGNLAYVGLATRLPRFLPFAVGFLIGGVPRFLTLAFDSPLWTVLAVAFSAGVGLSVVNPILGAVLYERIPERLQARVLGLATALSWAGIPLGSLLGGWLVDATSLRVALLAFGVAYLAATLLPFLGGPAWRQLDQDPTHR